MAGLALLLSATLLVADEPVRSSLFSTEKVTVVTVDVFVTDKDGKPIPGLTADDFEVFHDKQPVPITNFFAADGVSPGSSTETDPAPVAAAGDDDEAWPPAEELKLRLVVLVDHMNLSPQNRKRVFKSLREFPGECGPAVGRGADRQQRERAARRPDLDQRYGGHPGIADTSLQVGSPRRPAHHGHAQDPLGDRAIRATDHR